MADGTPNHRFFAVLSSILNVKPESLGPESSRDSLEEWDSIKHMYVMLALEEEFSIEFTDDEIANLANVSDLMHAMTAKTGATLSWL
jgi:acyl carrier protein